MHLEMGISSTRAVNSHISKGQKEKPRRDYPLVNTEYENRFSLKMAVKDKHCLVLTPFIMRREKKKKKEEGEVSNPTFKYQSLRRQGNWKYKAYSRLMMLIRSVAFLSAFRCF